MLNDHKYFNLSVILLLCFVFVNCNEVVHFCGRGRLDRWLSSQGLQLELVTEHCEIKKTKGCLYKLAAMIVAVMRAT